MSNPVWNMPSYPLADGLTRTSSSPPQDLIAPIECAPISSIRSLQLDRLQKIVSHAGENSALYKSKFKDANVSSSNIESLSDLSKFPLTTKSDLRDYYPFGMFAVPDSDIRRIHASSGTTGKPTVVGYTQSDIAVWSEVVARSMIASGVRPGDRVHVAYGYGLFTGGLGAHYGAEFLGCSVIPMSGGQTARQVQLICDFQPRVIMVTPSYMLALADEFTSQGIDPSKSSLEIGIFGAEPWTESSRQEIERIFNIKAVDIFGLSEIIGPGVANECIETQDGLYIWEDHFYPEIIDPITEEVLPDGEEGELVLTTLSKYAMPIIRYRTRDITCLRSGKARSMRRIDKITGRSDDMIILRGVNIFPTQIEEQILALPILSAHFELRLFHEGSKDVMEVSVESRELLAESVSTTTSQELITRIKDIVGVTVRVRVCASYYDSSQ